MAGLERFMKLKLKELENPLASLVITDGSDSGTTSPAPPTRDPFKEKMKQLTVLLSAFGVVLSLAGTAHCQDPDLSYDLIGGDLTDPEDDGDPEFDDGYAATFESSEEPDFAGGESAFNVFDNVLGPGNDKWCCGDGATFPDEPIWVQATFEAPIVLTHFTISSANDAPDRDPIVWEIQGSNNGEDFVTIFRQDDDFQIWDDRLQVALYEVDDDYPLPDAYSTIRFSCESTLLTNAARFQLGELEFFGTLGNTEDSDDDGMSDSYEMANGLDPDVNDADGDLDGDSLTNKQEHDLGTRANSDDSDGDTLKDGVETNTGTFVDATDTGTNPLRSDTDGDDLKDNVETKTGVFGSAANTGTDPLNKDTDGDGFEDGQEVDSGTNPLLASSFPRLPILGSELLGGDLTDPEDDGDPELDDGYAATFDSSEEPDFGGGESAFNVFDNVMGGGNDKWCCGDGADFPDEPLWVSATFEEPILLTHFTITSADDSPGRDPLIWEIQGSNDGENFATINRQEDTVAIWDTRLQVAEFRAGIQYPKPSAFTTIRFICFETGLTSGARFQIAELELFGEPGSVSPGGFQITNVERITRDGQEILQITFPSTANGTYAIETGTKLQNSWSEIIDGFESQGDATVYELEMNAPVPAELYIRVREE